jgi:hypothetical protein
VRGGAAAAGDVHANQLDGDAACEGALLAGVEATFVVHAFDFTGARRTDGGDPVEATFIRHRAIDNTVEGSDAVTGDGTGFDARDESGVEEDVEVEVEVEVEVMVVDCGNGTYTLTFTPPRSLPPTPPTHAARGGLPGGTGHAHDLMSFWQLDVKIQGGQCRGFCLKSAAISALLYSRHDTGTRMQPRSKRTSSCCC